MRSGRWSVLVALCLSVFTVNVSTTIVNIALPSLVEDIGATTRDLLWIVDAYNLAFAALVLAAGSLSDRFGRRKALMTGLVVFAVAGVAGALVSSPGPLIISRAVAGIGAAVVFPTTLSILTNVFPDRNERAKAIGIWGAATGVAVATGPIVGGFLLEHSEWGSIFVFIAVVAVVALALTAWLVPDSSDPATPPLDIRGLVLSSLGLGLLVHAIIEAPDRGWGSTTSVVALLVAVAVLAAFVLAERRAEHPMLDVRLFTNLRFTAASGAVTVAFFALFGFVFLITQYFQFLRGYGPLETGVRMLPVAVCLAIASLLGARLAVRAGTKLTVAAGLLCLVAAFGWIASVNIDTSYASIVGQMVLLGAGMGLTSTPATEAIMGVVPAAKAGIGSAVNDATRELGGTLGVAVIGSVALSLYRDTIATAGLPPVASDAAQASVGAAYQVAAQLTPSASEALRVQAQNGFMDGLTAGCLVGAGVALAGVLLVLRFLPAHPVTSKAPPREAVAEPA